MHKLLLFSISIILLSCQSYSFKDLDKLNDKQTLDSLSIQNLKGNDIIMDTNTIKDLTDLGKIWGFLKYYHPNITEGQYNWDNELFRFLPQYLSRSTVPERDTLLVNWIKGLGEFETVNKSKLPDSVSLNIYSFLKRELSTGIFTDLETTPENVKMYPELDWITESGFSPELVKSLDLVRIGKRVKEGYYYSQNGVGGAKIKHEKPYEEMEYSNPSMCLLSLYRYWNIVQYLSPYKYTIDGDWQEVLEEFIPKYLSANDELSYEKVVAELIVRTQDTHASFRKENSSLFKWFGERYPPIEITFVEEKAIVTHFYDKKNRASSYLEIGDEVLEINGLSVANGIKVLTPYISGSNYPTKLRNIATRLLASNDSVVEIKFLHDGIENKLKLTTFKSEELDRRSLFISTDTSFRMLNNNIGYINNGALKKKDLAEIWPKIKNTDGLIIDNRNYPSNFVIYDMSALLLDEKVPFASYTRVSVVQPGLFTFAKKEGYVGGKNKEAYQGKVIILVNEVTQSSSEFHAMAYRTAPGALVVGSTTAGADGNVSKLVLPGGINSFITGIGVYYPDRSETQRVGIVPDVIVKPTITGVKQGKDEVLEKAVQLLLESK